MLTLVGNLQYCQIALIIQRAKPGKKHALNNQYASNSELRLLTRVYGRSLFYNVNATISFGNRLYLDFTGQTD